jgi:hypothetical protein
VKTLSLVRSGLNHRWKVGEVGLLAVWYRLCFRVVIDAENESGRLVCLSDCGEVDYCRAGEVVTVEGYEKHLEYMRADLTGKQYEEAKERAREASFTPPPNWDEIVQRATHSLIESKAEA